MRKKFKVLKAIATTNAFVGIIVGTVVGSILAFVFFDPIVGLSKAVFWGVVIGSALARVENYKTGFLVGMGIGIPITILQFQFNTESSAFTLFVTIFAGLGFGIMVGGGSGFVLGCLVGGLRAVNGAFNDIKQVKLQVAELELKVNEIHTKLGMKGIEELPADTAHPSALGVNSLLIKYNLTAPVLFEVINLIAAGQDGQAAALLRESSALPSDDSEQVLAAIKQRISSQPHRPVLN